MVAGVRADPRGRERAGAHDGSCDATNRDPGRCSPWNRARRAGNANDARNADDAGYARAATVVGGVNGKARRPTGCAEVYFDLAALSGVGL